MFKKISLLFTLLILPFFLFAKDIIIFHTSDTHGFYYPRKVGDNKIIGGFALLKGYIDQYSDDYLLLDSGDFSSGTQEAKKSEGATSVELMNAVGYTATTIGNHEGDFKEEAFLKNIKNFKFDVLAANVYDISRFGDSINANLQKFSHKQNLFDLKSNNKAQGYPEGVKPYNIYEIGGKKIAVIGIAKKLSKKISNKIQITEGRKEIKDALKALALKPHDATILLIHNSIKDDDHVYEPSTIELLKDIKGIDLVLGGHAHKILQYQNRGVKYVESGKYIEGLSQVVLTFDDKTGKLTNIRAKYVELDSAKIEPNKKIQGLAEKIRMKDLDTIIGKALECIKVINYKRNEMDSPLGNLFTDIIKDFVPQADFAMHNTGSVRVDILKGDITKRDIINAFPFPDKVMLVRVNGDFIRKLIESTLKEEHSLFQYSKEVKIKYRWKNDKAELLSVKINEQNLDKDKIYTIALNEWNAQGNDEGSMFKQIEDKKNANEIKLDEIFANYIKTNAQGIYAPSTGRIKKVK